VKPTLGNHLTVALTQGTLGLTYPELTLT